MTKRLYKNSIRTGIVSSILLLVFLGASCSQSTQEHDGDELRTKVIAVHDTAMYQMKEMMKLKRELNKLKEQKEDAVQIAKIDNSIQALNLADEHMMQWMRAFSASFPDGTLMDHQAAEGHDHGMHHEAEHGPDAADQEKLLKEELIKIEKIASEINESINNAKQILNKAK